MNAVALAAACLCAASLCARAECPSGLHAVTTAELFFGGDDSGQPISAADWSAFVDAEVTPRLPFGLTVWSARGQWRAPGGAIVREPSRVMQVVLPGTAGERGRLAAVIAAYKARFHQHSVLLTEHRDCASY